VQQCPQCQSEVIHRSRTRNRWESWRKEITGKRPYRCHACGWRGWGEDYGPKFDESEVELATRALVPDPPNLKATAFARVEGSRELDLNQLDTLAPVPKKKRKKSPQIDGTTSQRHHPRSQ